MDELFIEATGPAKAVPSRPEQAASVANVRIVALLLSMHAAIAQSDVSVNRTDRERFVWIGFVAVWVQETITNRGRVQLQPVGDANC